jgi:hypothetical protein
MTIETKLSVAQNSQPYRPLRRRGISVCRVESEAAIISPQQPSQSRLIA